MNDIENVEALILEMQEIKTKYPSLEIQDVLRLFNIQALRDLTRKISRLNG